MGKRKGLSAVVLRGLIPLLVLGVAAGTFVTASAQEKGTPMTLILLAYSGQDTAKETFDMFKKNQPELFKALESYAVVSKNPDGETKVQEKRKGDVAGDVIESVVGVAQTPSGAAAGGAILETPVTIKKNEAPEEAKERVKSQLRPDSSMIAALVQQSTMQQVMDQLQQKSTTSNQYKITIE